MSASKNLQVGDPCFAKVKGWIPYPAKIMELRNNGKKVRYSVLFYGTQETAVLGGEGVWPINDNSVKKFVTPKTLIRKIFKLGFEEMTLNHKLEAKEGTKEKFEDEEEDERSEESEETDKSLKMILKRLKTIRRLKL